MPKKRYEKITDLPDELLHPLFGKPHNSIFKKNLRFSLGEAHWDLMVSLVVLCFFWVIVFDDLYGQKHYFAPVIVSCIIYGISKVRHHLDYHKKRQKWESYCQGYLDRLNKEGN